VPRRRVVALGVALALPGALALGCGAGDSGGSTDPGVTAEQPAVVPTPAEPPVTTTAGKPPTTATEPTATTGVPTATTPDGGGGGDEEPIRVPAAFTVTGSAITPATVTVPAFLAVEVRITAKDGKAHDLRLDAPGGGPIALAAGGSTKVRLTGLQPGSYPLIADGGRLRATLRVTTDAPGP
jgi:hypothetical protein